MGQSETKQLQNKIQTEIGYNFKDINLLEQALTHDSLRAQNLSIPTYERLEFLGDSALYFIISNYLFLKHPQDNEGKLSTRRQQLVSGSFQQEIAKKLELQKYIQVADSVKRQQLTSRMTRIDDFVESIIGAVYLDAGGHENGLRSAKNVIYKLWNLQDPSTNACVIA